MMTQPDENATLDFDAFWRSHSQQHETVRILGEDVPVPTDVPAWLALQPEQVDTANPETIRTAVTALYGSDAYDRWLAGGMGLQQLSILIAWTLMRAQGSTATFGEAAEQITQQMQDSQGDARPPAANRQQRRSKGRGRRR